MRVIEKSDRARPQLAAPVRPFALLMAIAVVSLVLPVDSPRVREIVVALMAIGVLVAAQVFVTARSRPDWMRAIPAFGGFVVIALLRDATGGSSSGLSVLVVAPSIYLAFAGSRRELQIASVLTGLTFVVPLLLAGGPRYSAEEWRRALIWMAAVALVGSMVQRLVRDLHEESAQSRRTQTHLQMVLDGAELSAMIVTDLRGVVTLFGVGAERILGLHAADVIGRRLDEFHDPTELESVAAEVGASADFETFAVLARSRSNSRVWTWARHDDSPVQVRSAVTELRDAGTPVGYLTVAIDVTDEVNSAAALRNAEQRWRVVMDHLPDTTLVVADTHLDVTLVSGAGSMREKLEHGIGQPLAQVASPENVVVLTDLATKALAGFSSLVDLGSARTGHEHEVSVVPLPHVDGSSDALILARDVSRDRARQRALYQAKERAERMFADAPVAIVLHDTDGMVLSANPSALRLFETTRDVFVGSDLARLSVGPVGPDGRAVADFLAHLRRSGVESAEGRWTLTLGEGREKFLSLTSRMLHDDPDHPDLVLTHIVDRTEQHHLEVQLLHLADHDPLTGLANRRRFDAELARHLETCRRYGPEGALLMLDLDGFKQVNDTLGHAVGDELLSSVAELLTQDLRASDVVARLGGDEFSVLLPRVTRGDAEVVASSLVRSVRRAMRRHEGPAADVTISVGVSMVEDSDQTPTHLRTTADLALYQAKERGRDQYVVFDPNRLSSRVDLV